MGSFAADGGGCVVLRWRERKHYVTPEPPAFKGGFYPALVTVGM